jgi:hypothetical protein
MGEPSSTVARERCQDDDPAKRSRGSRQDHEDDRSMLIRRRRAGDAPDKMLVQMAGGDDRAMLVLQYATALLAVIGAFLLAGFR